MPIPGPRSFSPRRLMTASLVAIALLLPVVAVHGQKPFVPNGAHFPNDAGTSNTYSTTGEIDLTNPFFQTLGSNGRTCGSCHQPGDGMSVSAAHVQQRFDLSDGLDPIFRTVDGSNCHHDIDVSSVSGRSAAYSLLRTRGLIRIAIDVPATADFAVVSVDNLYSCNETDKHLDVPAAPAVDEPPVSERSDVRRTRVDAADRHHENPVQQLSDVAPERSGAPVRGRDRQSRPGGWHQANAGRAAADRGLRDRALHGAGHGPGCRPARRTRRTRRRGGTRRAALLHRHQLQCQLSASAVRAARRTPDTGRRPSLRRGSSTSSTHGPISRLPAHRQRSLAGRSCSIPCRSPSPA